jgi:hypothetical protein
MSFAFIIKKKQANVSSLPRAWRTIKTLNIP